MAQAANSNVESSALATAGAVGDDCTHVALWNTAVGGDLLWRQAISTDPSALALGERLQIVSGALVIDVPTATGETEAMAQRKAQGAITGGVWVSFHTGDPGSTGTDNQITELGYTGIAEADWTIS